MQHHWDYLGDGYYNETEREELTPMVMQEKLDMMREEAERPAGKLCQNERLACCRSGMLAVESGI
jgi:hypothetical protein